MPIPRHKLATGHEMPTFGLGTWQLEGDTCTQAVRTALEMGHDLIDTADVYGNHEQIAPAIAEVSRSSYFITSKVNRGSLHYDDVLRTCEKNLHELGIDFLDLYLVHWPDESAPMEETFRALRKLVDEGMTRSIGVSNFMVEDLEEALSVAEVPICNNQISLNPTKYNREVVEFCQERDLLVTAYSPIARGGVFEDEVIRGVADKVGKTAGQVALRWLLQKDLVVIPKASSEGHLRENLDIFEWELPPEEEAEIDAIDA